MKHKLHIKTIGILLYLLCSSMFSFAQERVSGKVIDDNGNPIAMVNVMLYPGSLAKHGENGAFPPTRDGCIHSLSMRKRG